jgi:hypothetical protein
MSVFSKGTGGSSDISLKHKISGKWKEFVVNIGLEEKKQFAKKKLRIIAR